MKTERGLSGACLKLGTNKDGDCKATIDLREDCRSSWYLSREEIENNSPSRKDGVDLRKESQLRTLYCSFIQDVGMRLGVPQLTIATAMMLCHRFYLHQSHAKNEWQTVATVCVFLASKVEDTPCFLDKVVVVAYETMYQRDSAAARKIHQKDVLERQKALIVIGERLVLCTTRFDFNIQHPYKPLHEACKKLGITQKDVRQVAWNFVNDWLRTTLCLQYKPHYIAAGSLYLACKLYNVKLPTGRSHAWWHEFEVMPQQLNAVIYQMVELSGHKTRPVVAHAPEKPEPVKTPLLAKEDVSSSPDSCVLSRPGSSVRSSSHEVEGEAQPSRPTDTGPQCEPTGSESPNGVVEHCGTGTKVLDQSRSDPDHLKDGLHKIDLEKIKTLMKRRKRGREDNRKKEALDDSSEDAWIEKELECGIESAAKSLKKQRVVAAVAALQ
ncbi:uncharacterized protein M6B38_119310 [Iris pallida]|uniref:Cyclin-like domain-containing protein n=1 Tax=Iris pallida TaxID=29817 RepID=A0AAX6HIN2_IRIPA|nr:uncharacterized protein M6B38_119310 [Iris pallida]